MAQVSRQAISDRLERKPFAIGFSENAPYFELLGDGEATLSPGQSAAQIVVPDGRVPYSAFWAQLRYHDLTLTGPIVLLVEANEYPPLDTGRNGALVNNVHLERVWVEALLSARRLNGKTTGIATVDSRYLGSVEGDLPRHRPLAHCRKTGRFIEPVCPVCLGVMETCRDETLLRQVGLPSFSRSVHRFLFCPSCAESRKSSLSFYTYELGSLDSPGRTARVRRRSELYRDLTPQIKEGSAQAPDRHACFTCEHRQDCYPAGSSGEEPVPAESELTTIAYYDFCFLPIEPLPFDFDDVAAILGGAKGADIQQRASRPLAHPDSELRKEIWSELGDDQPQYLLRESTPGLFTFEVLLLKLTAFRDLVQGVLSLYERSGRPHLAISAERIGGAFSSGTTTQPTRWGISLALTDLVTTTRLDVRQTSDLELPIWSIPHPSPSSYLPKSVGYGQSETLYMQLRTRRFEITTRGKAHTAKLEAELVSEQYRRARHGMHDLVELTSAQLPAIGSTPLVMVGRKTEGLTYGFVFEGTIDDLTPDMAKALEASGFPESLSVTAAITRTFSSPADVFSLGVVLHRLLFLSDEQDPATFDSRRVLERMSGAVAEAARDSATPDMAARGALRKLIGHEEIRMDSLGLLYRKADRTHGRSEIPPTLWEDTLILMLRMASSIEGWSVCSGMDGFPSEQPEQPIIRVANEVDSLIRRTRDSLFGSEGRNRIVLEVLDDFWTDFRAATTTSDLSPLVSELVEATRMLKKWPADDE